MNYDSYIYLSLYIYIVIKYKLILQLKSIYYILIKIPKNVCILT